LPRKDLEQRKVYFKEYYTKHKKNKQNEQIEIMKPIEIMEPIMESIEILEPIETKNKNEETKKDDVIQNVTTSNLTNHITQPQNHIMNIPLKLKEKILKSKLLRINEFILKEVSEDPMYLDILADEYRYNLSSTLGALEFVKFLESYFGRYF